MRLGDEMNPHDPTLRPTAYLDYETPELRAFVDETVRGTADPTERVVRLFYAVRDGIRYDPYSYALDPDHFRASATLARKEGFCVPKAILLAASCRGAGIPARLRFADVRNHLATERLLEMMGTDVFAWHGYTEIFLGGRWLKATPTFNLSLCERFGVKPLDFDGREDSVLHPFDTEGRQHMEYLADHGSFDDFPFEQMIEAWRATYPTFDFGQAGGDFEREAAEENPGTGHIPVSPPRDAG